MALRPAELLGNFEDYELNQSNNLTNKYFESLNTPY